MNSSEFVLRQDEKAMYKLRSIYAGYGYSPYKLNKFEEYDLYAKNKSFLVSENLLTFTDTNGKLMALKPDVTLSIIKNAVADDKQSYRLYYSENVYRTTPGGNGFREIMQTGLEAIGNIDPYSQCEVLMLAAKSLESISKSYLLDLSHMKFVEGLFESANVKEEDRAELLSLFGSKNLPGIKAFCANNGIEEKNAERLLSVAGLYLPLTDALNVLEGFVEGEKMKAAYDELCVISSCMKAYGIEGTLYLDLSVVNDMSYYDGIIFKGFIDGIPDSVLSGGRYDKLLERFGKKREAVGFAVYLDKLEYFGRTEESFDADVLLVYGEAKPEDVIARISELCTDGISVKAVKTFDDSIKTRKTVIM